MACASLVSDCSAMTTARYRPTWDLALDPLVSCKLCLGEYPLEQMTTLAQCQCIFCTLVGLWEEACLPGWWDEPLLVFLHPSLTPPQAFGRRVASAESPSGGFHLLLEGVSKSARAPGRFPAQLPLVQKESTPQSFGSRESTVENLRGMRSPFWKGKASPRPVLHLVVPWFITRTHLITALT